MEVIIKEENGRRVAALCGALNTAASIQAEKDLEPLLRQHSYDVVLDCEQLEYISSSGLRLLLTLYKHQRDAGHRAILTHVNEDVREVLELGGFLGLYVIEE